MTRLVLLRTSPRVASGLLSSKAWVLLHAGPVYVAAAVSQALPPGALEGVDAHLVEEGSAAESTAALLLEAARVGTVTWWGFDGEDPVAAAVRELATARGIGVDEVDGSWDLPGARLLDVVATMDRLRSPGGCPWDAEQDRRSLAPYLLEEAYEAFQAIEDDDVGALRDELGDVLLQVAFHARMAEELDGDQRFTIDDVADRLVAKLVRRHPHVFADVAVDGAPEVSRNWDAIKKAERGGMSSIAHVPMAAPALTLATTLQRKASREGADVTAGALDDLLEGFLLARSAESAGQLLWALVAACQEAGIDAEATLRAQCRRFRDGFIDEDGLHRMG